MCGSTALTMIISTLARYSDADLCWWADRIREWHRQNLNVFAYFNNDGYGHAVTNARRLRTLTNS